MLSMIANSSALVTGSLTLSFTVSILADEKGCELSGSRITQIAGNRRSVQLFASAEKLPDTAADDLENDHIAVLQGIAIGKQLVFLASSPRVSLVCKDDKDTVPPLELLKARNGGIGFVAFIHLGRAI
jgi:hypothetical protein